MTHPIQPHDEVKRLRVFVVLVVEDDPLVRLWAEDEFLHSGHNALSAQSADEALLALHQNWESVDILFTDVHMPGDMDGLALAHYVQQHWPSIRILIASGGAHDQQLPVGSRFLSKPYQFHQVMHHMGELMAA